MNMPETLKTPCLSGLGKIPQGILRQQNTRGFFGFESSFQNCFWILFITSDLEEKLSNKFINFLPYQSLNFMVLGYTSKKSQVPT
jgi:hypothetical protein